MLVEWLSQHDLIVINEGMKPTSKRGHKTSRPNITLASARQADEIDDRRVKDEETASGYKYITFKINLNN